MTYFSKQYHDPGTAPGTLISAAGAEAAVPIYLPDYTSDAVEEIRLARAEDCHQYLQRDSKTWIQVNGPANPDTLREPGDLFDLHDLALEEDPFEPVRKRMRLPDNRRFTSRDIDCLLYALLDLITDSGFPVLERFGDQLEDMETALLERPSHQTLTEIHRVKRELLLLPRPCAC
ncbi:MAG: hypothetical protein RIC38_15130 [Chromatocurvus sp.]